MRTDIALSNYLNLMVQLKMNISLVFVHAYVCFMSVWFAESTSPKDLPYVTSLTVNGKGGVGPHFISRNHRVNIVCSWGNGNPPATVRLLDRNDNILQSLNVSGDIRYTLPPDSCNSTGILRCSAAGSKNNMSTLLALECPPIFNKQHLNITVKYGENLYQNIPVTAHTLSISECWLTYKIITDSVSHKCKISNISVSSSMTQNEKCKCVMTGVVPNLALAVTLYNITDFDDGKWHLDVTNEIGSSRVDVYVIVRDIPARVTSLTLNGHDGLAIPVRRNQTVTIVCTWDHVYPPATVRLIDKHEKVLLSYNDKSGKMTQDFPFVRCNDAGTFRCEASGSSRNMSATLLVQCPPEFVDTTNREVIAFPGRPLSLAFQVRMHTTQITECDIAPYSLVVGKIPSEVFLHGKRLCTIINKGDVEDRTQSHIPSKDAEKCRCSVNGTAPDLTFNIDVHNIAVEDGGLWRTNVANHEGEGHVDYFLLVTKDENGNPGKSATTAAIVIIVIIIIIVTIIRLIKKDRFALLCGSEIIPCQRLMIRRPVELFLLRTLDLVRLNRKSTRNSHIYTDIIETSEDAVIPAAERVIGSITEEPEEDGYLLLIHKDPEATSRTSVDGKVSDVIEKHLATRPDDDCSIFTQSGSDRASVKTDYLMPVAELSQEGNTAVHLTHYETCPYPEVPIDQPTLSAESDCVQNSHILVSSENVSADSAILRQFRKEVDVNSCIPTNLLIQNTDGEPDELGNVSNNGCGVRLQRLCNESSTSVENQCNESKGDEQRQSNADSTLLQPQCNTSDFNLQHHFNESDSGLQSHSNESDSAQCRNNDSDSGSQIRSNNPNSGSQSRKTDSDSSSQSQCIQSDSGLQSQCIQSDSGLQSQCFQSDSGSQSQCIQSDSGLQSQCIQSDSGLQSQCIQSDSGLQSQCIQSDSGLQSQCIQSDSGSQSRKTDSDSSSQSQCIQSDLGSQSQCIQSDSGLQSQCIQSDSGLQSQCIQSYSGLQSQCIQSYSGLQSQCIQSDSGLQSQCIQSDSGLQSQCFQSDSGSQSRKTDSDSSSQSQCIQSDSGSQSQCIQSDSGLQSQCIQSDSGLQSQCIQSDSGLQSQCIQSDSGLQSQCIQSDSGLQSQCNESKTASQCL